MADTDIRVLNSLATTLKDSVDGYTESAEGASERFSSIFRQRAQERTQVLSQLRQEISRLGGTPDTDGSLLAAGHRAFLDLKAAVTGRDDKAIIAEVERGEDHLKSKFEEALQETDLSTQTREAINTAWSSVKSSHDQIRDLKESLEA